MELIQEVLTSTHLRDVLLAPCNARRGSVLASLTQSSALCRIESACHLRPVIPNQATTRCVNHCLLP